MKHAIGYLCACACGLVAGCSSAARTGGDARCAIAAEDSALFNRGELYTVCNVDRRAVAVTTPLQMDPTASMMNAPRGQTCMYAEVQFVVGTDGIPEPATARLIKTNFSELGHAVMQQLPAWRYRPALKNDQPVRQLVKERKVIATAVRVVVVTRGGEPSARPPSGPPPRCQ